MTGRAWGLRRVRFRLGGRHGTAAWWPEAPRGPSPPQPRRHGIRCRTRGPGLSRGVLSAPRPCAGQHGSRRDAGRLAQKTKWTQTEPGGAHGQGPGRAPAPSESPCPSAWLSVTGRPAAETGMGPQWGLGARCPLEAEPAEWGQSHAPVAAACPGPVSARGPRAPPAAGQRGSEVNRQRPVSGHRD